MLTECYDLRPGEADFRIMLAKEEFVMDAWIREGEVDYVLCQINPSEMLTLLDEWKRRGPVVGRPTLFSIMNGIVKFWPTPECKTHIVIRTEIDWPRRREREDFELRQRETLTSPR